MEDIVIVGAGGLAREVRELIEDCNEQQHKWNILGWISKENPGTIISGLPVLGDDDWLMRQTNPIHVVICVGSSSLRRKIATQYRQNPNLRFPNIISPLAKISPTLRLGEGCIIAANNLFTVDIVIGDFFVCNYGCTIGHDCCFQDYVTLFPGSHISGNVTLEEGSSVGVGANIIQGLTVGKDSFIGAGAAVIRDIPANCTAVGVPAKPIIR